MRIVWIWKMASLVPPPCRQRMAGLPAEPPVVVLLVIWNWEVIWKAGEQLLRGSLGKRSREIFCPRLVIRRI